MRDAESQRTRTMRMAIEAATIYADALRGALRVRLAEETSDGR